MWTSHLLTVPSQISTITTHPKKPLLSVGTITGHVYTYTWQTDPTESFEGKIGTPGSLTAGYNLLWSTKRHKGSCRSIGYSYDGDVLYSTGTDNIIKAASISTGQVQSKLAVPSSSSSSSPSETDFPTHLLPITPQTLVIGTDLGNLHLYDLRSSPSSGPSITHTHLHDSYISSISALPPTAASTSNIPRALITTGDCTLRHIDLRKTSKEDLEPPSDPQDDDLLSSCVVQNVGKNRRFTRAYIGMDNGTIHAFERGVWSDMVERIKIAPKGTEVDILTDVSQCEEFGRNDKKGGVGGGMIAAGCGDGIVRVVKLGGNRVVEEFEHKEGVEGGEGVVGLAVDCDGAMVSAGGEGVRIWYEGMSLRESSSDDDDDDESGDSDDDSDDSDDNNAKRVSKVKADQAFPTIVQPVEHIEAADNDSDDGSSGGWSSDSDDSDTGKSSKKKKKSAKEEDTNKRKRKKGKENMKGLASRKKTNAFAGLD